jgi:AAA15 family ATPase/GTPase
MRLDQVQLQNIYSYKEATLKCCHHVTALVGPNDAGKSNILRALDNVAGPTRSLDLAKMQCKFEEGEPVIGLRFIAEATEREKLASILKSQTLPSDEKFPLDVSCRTHKE